MMGFALWPQSEKESCRFVSRISSLIAMSWETHWSKKEGDAGYLSGG
jgi:hypothetical protein